MKHEDYIREVREIVCRAVSDAAIRERLLACKLVYGIGDGTYRGVCYYGAWKNGHPHAAELVEIAATGEESPVQLAGTTLHELGHVLAGRGQGHGRTWAQSCQQIGLRCVKAAGTRYSFANFAPSIRTSIYKLSTLSDGSPIFGQSARGFVGLPPMRVRPCPLGQGTRGGTSRGKGSGSRMRKFTCGCVNPATGKAIPVRRASDTFNATCHDCGQVFTRTEGSN